MSRGSVVLGVVAVAVALGCRASAGSVSGNGETARLLATDREWGSLSGVSKSADSISAYWTDDARVVLPGQPVVSGKAAIREMVAGMVKIPGFHITWSPDSAVVSSSGDLGYTYGANEFTAPDSSGKLVTTHGRYLTVWHRDADGHWRCVQDYSTPAPALPGGA